MTITWYKIFISKYSLGFTNKEDSIADQNKDIIASRVHAWHSVNLDFIPDIKDCLQSI